jgi:hypothetical protein
MTLPKTLMSGLEAGDQLRVDRLRAAQRDTKARHHLVEDQQRAMLRAQLAQPFMKGTLARTKFMLPAMASIITQASWLPCCAKALQLGDVVVLEHQRVLDHLGRHAGAGRVAEGGQARAGLDQQRVGVAVVAAFELDDLRPAGGAARQAQRAHRGLGAAADQAHLFDRGHEFDDGLGQFGLGLGGGAEAQTRRAACVTASSTAGWPWPRIIGPQEPM